MDKNLKHAGTEGTQSPKNPKIRSSCLALTQVNKDFFFTVTLYPCDISKWHKFYLLVNLLGGLIYTYTKTTGPHICQENNANLTYKNLPPPPNPA